MVPRSGQIGRWQNSGDGRRTEPERATNSDPRNLRSFDCQLEPSDLDVAALRLPTGCPSPQREGPPLLVAAPALRPSRESMARYRLDGASVSTNAFGQTKLTDLDDPVSNGWRRGADMTWHREYHAVTVLVPDGRVVTTAGTGGPAQPGISNDVEAFEPPYLFRGIRPHIDALSTNAL